MISFCNSHTCTCSATLTVMSSFTLTDNDSVPTTESIRSHDDNSHLVYDPRLPSHQANSFTPSPFIDTDSVMDSAIFNCSDYATETDHVFGSQPETPYLPSASANGHSGGLSLEASERGLEEEFGKTEGPILPASSDMHTEECFALREWRRKSAIRLEEKEKSEKDILSQIVDEADEYKVNFYNRRKVTCENIRTTNREKEKIFLANQEKFYAEADENYWKAISELIPNEMPAAEMSREKKDQEIKSSAFVVQGPKPGKPTDLSRMRQILIKLKHNTPDHLNG